MKMKIVRGSSLSIPVAIVLISLPLLIALCAWQPFTHILEIVYAESSDRVFWMGIMPGERFRLEYTHSVHRSRVADGFEIDQDHNIVLVGTTFSDHGAGLPYKPHRGGKFSVLRNGKFNISGMYMVLPEILLRTGREYDNVFQSGGSRINLSKECGDALLIIRTRKFSTLRGLLRKTVNVG